MEYNFAKMSDEELRNITVLKHVNNTLSANSRLIVQLTANTSGILSLVGNYPTLGRHSLLVKSVTDFDVDTGNKVGIGFCWLGEQGIGWLGAYIIDVVGTDRWYIGYKPTGSTTITQLGVAMGNANPGDKLLVLLDVFRTKVSGSLHETEISFTLTVYINGTMLDQHIFTAANQVPHNLEYLAPGFVLTRPLGTVELELTNMSVSYNNRLFEAL